MELIISCSTAKKYNELFPKESKPKKEAKKEQPKKETKKPEPKAEEEEEDIAPPPSKKDPFASLPPRWAIWTHVLEKL